ncbi:hypothetical protein SIM91_00765 [Rhodococcus opacus]|uniref:hypothetical protein n=1 Tax=Rhodococcus opacus TaxID=37919 RepID=UPI0029C4FB00|nr:hypothetical protein [Rhodococcus opacus]MDX5961893.1 hypothetical protein [Rhodococcus opacus]
MSDLTPARRCLAPTVVILALLAITLAGLLVATLMRLNSDDASTIDASPTDAGSAAPPAEAERAHAALHDMAALCAPDTDEAAQRRIESDVDLLVAFTRAYPDANFPIDDETGRSPGLLLIARKEMQVCAPTAAAHANAALPPQFRDDPATGADMPPAEEATTPSTP